MKWIVDTKDKPVVVEARYGKIFISGAGEVFVDGKLAKSWGGSPWGLPKEVPFEIAGKPALLRRKGIMDQNFNLFVDGKLIEQV